MRRARPDSRKIREAYSQANEHKELLILEGSAHAQAIFSTETGDELMRDIVAFLSVEEPCDRQCLLDALARYLDAVSRQRPELVPLSPNAVVRENTRDAPSERCGAAFPRFGRNKFSPMPCPVTLSPELARSSTMVESRTSRPA